MNNYMNIPIPYYINPNIIQEIKLLEEKISKLEKEVEFIMNRININNKQEEVKYTNTYQTQSYNMM